MRRTTKTNAIALAIPAYNAESFLPRLLESARNQTTPFGEILVYDDCSRDGTPVVARRWGAEVFTGPANVGCSAGKNRLLAETRCEWIHFHDADDDMLPNFTTLATRWIESGHAPDVVLFDYEYRDNESRELIGRTTFDDVALRADPIRYAIRQQINPFCGLYRVAKLRAVGGYDLDPAILYNEDVAFHCKLALHGLTFRAEHELAVINYLVRGSMSDANALKCIQAHHAVMRRMMAAVGARYPREIAKRLWFVATGYAYRLMWADVDRALDEAWEIFPGVPDGNSRAFGRLCVALGPKRAFRLRERAIRLHKPRLRTR